jgi:mannose/cellobiose epimerase-like protein (N-acyl-D-glucosamine 2-epimerase family)
VNNLNHSSLALPTLQAEAEATHDWLIHWLTDAAYPLWSTQGVDIERGGFHEALDQNGAPIDLPRRSRVHPRQIFAFAQAQRFGWRGNSIELVRHGVKYFLDHFRGPDGLYTTLVAPDGVRLSAHSLLYDQAFALFGFAAAAGLVGSEFGLAEEAAQLRQTLMRHYKRAGPGFESSRPPSPQLLSNPHMHLLEASLVWRDRSAGAEWQAMADDLGELALSHLIDRSTGVLCETFDANWRPATGISGRIVEPGHQYEWAHLLLRWAGVENDRTLRAACRLIDNAERFSLRDGVVINAMLDDFSVRDCDARLWPQAERLKAGATAARLLGGAYYWNVTLQAAHALARYLATPKPGLWFDRLLPSGQFVDEPASTSSFYHIVSAIGELTDLLAARTRAGRA